MLKLLSLFLHDFHFPPDICIAKFLAEIFSSVFKFLETKFRICVKSYYCSQVYVYLII